LPVSQNVTDLKGFTDAMMITSRMLLFAWTALLLSGCSYEFLFKDQLSVARQEQLFEKLCAADDRFVARKPVSVDGYLSNSRFGSCALGWNPVLKHGYRYAECVEVFDRPDPDVSRQPVLHFSLRDQGDPLCDETEAFFKARFRSARGGINRKRNYEREHAARLQGKCLAVERLDRPVSRYLAFADRALIDEGKLYSERDLNEKYRKLKDYQSAGKKKGLISVRTYQINDMLTGDVLLKEIRYSFFPHSRDDHAGLGLTVRECERNPQRIPVEAILVPSVFAGQGTVSVSDL
jgi:hypothetical protein